MNRTNCTSLSTREKLIALWSSGTSQTEVALRLGLSKQTVSNILKQFLETGTVFAKKPGGKERTVSTPQVVEFIEFLKISKPSTSTFEIQEALLENGICAAVDLPCSSTITDI